MTEPTNTSPGSLAARDVGCTCPVLDNGHGDPTLARERGGWVIREGCPIPRVPGSAEAMRTKRKPTHILNIEIPVYLDEEYDFNPIQDAILAVLSVSRAAFLDAICDDPQATITERLDSLSEALKR